MDSQTSALDSSLAGLQFSLCPTFQPTHTPTMLPRPLSMKQPKNSKPSSSPRYQKIVLTTNVPTKMQSLFTSMKLATRRAKGQIFYGMDQLFVVILSAAKDPLGLRALHSPEWILRCAQDDGSVMPG